MARFSYDEADNYGGQGGGGFFSLKNDGDSAVVRLLYNSIDDVEGVSVHRVEVDGKKRYVNCLREYNQPMDDCPFCRERMPVQAKLFIPVYNVDEDQVQVWERGKRFFGKISSLFSRYNKASIVSQLFEVVRRGKPKDTNTDYDFYRTDDPADDTQLEDFEVPKIVGGLVLDKSADDMEYFLESNEFPPEDDEEDVRPRRTQTKQSSRGDRGGRGDRTQSRRTPARNNRDDSF